MAKAKAGFSAMISKVHGRYRKVGSSALAGFSYNKRTKTLTVEFARDGSRYRYFDVPENIFLELQDPGSHGEYFNQAIRNRFSFERA